MRRIGIVARVTYLLSVRSGTFLMLTLGLPLLILIPIGIAAFQELGSSAPALGYVDQTGRFTGVNEVQVEGKTIHLEAFADIGSARTAQLAKTISAYVVVPAGYFQGEGVRLYGKDNANDQTRRILEIFMRRGLLPGAQPQTIDRLGDPLGNLEFVAVETGSTARDGFAMALGVIFPLLLAGLFSFLVLTNAGQMGAAFVREKDHRALEIVLTSLPAWQLVAGKVIGIALLSLTQIAVWIAGGAIILPIALAVWAPGQTLNMPLDVLGWALALFLPGYFLYVTVTAGVGIVAGDARQAQQAASAFGLLAMTPFFVIAPLLEAPDSPLAIVLSIFPFTAPMIAVMRLGLTAVPTWQLLAGIGSTFLTLLGSIWVVARIFRVAMLLYGQPPRLSTIWNALRGAEQSRVEVAMP